MNRAIQLAQLGIRACYPNPMVGAVIVYNNRIIGEAYHQKYGEAHAEVNAINAVKDPTLLSQSTIYVSLEPCAHFGKTPPCVDLLIEHNFKRVVVACKDIFSKVNGLGLEKLRQKGIEVVYPVLEKESLAINKRFFTFHQKKRPYIILKWAETKDGFIDKIRSADETGTYVITNEWSQLKSHAIRSTEHAILVGWKTIQNDNPRLNTRYVEGQHPIRIVLDPNLKANPNSAVFNDGLPTIVFNQQKETNIGNTRFVHCSMENLTSILTKLHELNLQSVIVEGGANTLKPFIEQGIWDEAYRFVGNKTLGKGIRTLQLFPAPDKTFHFGDDVCFYYTND
jgi:diaminohydroxyphosphoribosylaminopyrimidine deaminase/5-amino-6-(5-phosphoribosylamino)uracil reductase